MAACRDRSIKHPLYTFGDFKVGHYYFVISLRVFYIASILMHQSGAAAQRKNAPRNPVADKINAS